MSPVFGAMAAREFDAARLLALTGDLPAATGPVNQVPAVPPAAPIPPLPALLTPAAKADVEAAFRNVGEQIQYGTAALEALARMNDASLAGDAASVTLQEAAAADLLDRWAGALGGGAAARKLAQDALALAGGVGPVTFTPAEAEPVADAVNGIYPADLAAGLDGIAASPGTRGLAAVALAELKPTDLVNYTPTLVDAEQAQAEANAVVEMRALALALRTPGDGPATDPVAGRSEKASFGGLKPVACRRTTSTAAQGAVAQQHRLCHDERRRALGLRREPRAGAGRHRLRARSGQRQADPDQGQGRLRGRGPGWPVAAARRSTASAAPRAWRSRRTKSTSTSPARTGRGSWP